MQDCDEDSDKGYMLETDFKYPEELHRLPSDLSFILKRMKNKK